MKISSSYNYVTKKHIYEGLKWEKELREDDLLVSELLDSKEIANEYLALIIQNEPPSNKDYFSVENNNNVALMKC